MAEKTFKILLEEKFQELFDDDFYIVLHEEFYKLMFKYIPYDTGVLASTTDIKLDENNNMSDEMSMSMGLSSGNITKDGIVFKAPYANKMYFNTMGFNIHKEKHPHATSNWGDVAFTSEYGALVNIMNEYLERRLRHGQ